MFKFVRSSFPVVGLSLAATLSACSGSPPPSASPSASSSAPTGSGIKATVAHTHDGLKTPSFVWLDATNMVKQPGATAIDVANGTLRAVARDLKLSDSVVASAHVSHLHDTGRGAIITRYSQSHEGIDVFNSELNIAMRRDLSPVSMTGSLAPSLRNLVPAGWSLDGRAAIAQAFAAMTKQGVSPAGMAANGTDSGGYDRFLFTVAGPGKGTFDNARVKKVWYPSEHGLTPGWYVELKVADFQSGRSRLHGFVINAATGATLFENDMSASDSFTYKVWSDKTGPQGRIAPLESPEGNDLTPTPYASIADAQGKTEPAYIASAPVTLANTPFLHSDTDFWLPSGASDLTGNNVVAYSDSNGVDGYQANSTDRKVSAVPAGSFLNNWDLVTPPAASGESTDAVTTNLFFIVNYMHDLFYDSGYDEKSRNSQAMNYGRGGVEGDPILAESQDYSGIDNANCQTPADGNSPVIQMYQWNTRSSNSVTITAPGNLAKTITNSGATGFGTVTKGWSVSGNLALYTDTGATTHGACVAAAAKLPAGSIALIDRAVGTCDTATRALNAIDAGAKAVLYVWKDDTTVPKVIGTSPFDPNDPANDPLSTFDGNIIGLTDGQALITAVGAGTTATVTLFLQVPLRDGSVDGGIVSHEWGHSLSNRLIGNGSGLSNVQGRGMGEGWSDFVALLTYTRATDAQKAYNQNWQGAFPMGTYADGGFPADLYYGIRRYPYSNDFVNKDPLSFRHISTTEKLPDSPPAQGGNDDPSGNNEVHNVGEIWASMLWDCWVSMLQDTTAYPTFEDSAKQMRDYLVASLKLTPSQPTFVEARDAVLAVALANTAKPNDFMNFAKAFARRGLGTHAVAPAKTSTDLTDLKESTVVGNDIEFIGATMTDDVASCDNDGILDAGETGTITVTARNSGLGTLSAATVKVSSTNPAVTFPDGDTVSLPTMAALTSNSAKIKIHLASGASVTGQTPLTLSFTVNGENLVVPAEARTGAAGFSTNFDWNAAASATDDVDAPDTTWVTGHAHDPAAPSFYDGDWTRMGNLDGSFGSFWFGVDAPAESEEWIISPELKVGAGNFSFTFDHAWAFETDLSDPQNPVYWDGGQVSISDDNGTTWTDLKDKFTQNGYNGKIVNDPKDISPILGQDAFVGKSTGFPTFVSSKVDLGTMYANKSVKVRFRTGSDLGGRDTGWLVDNIAFTGITNTPFTSHTGETTVCQIAGGDMGTGGAGGMGGAGGTGGHAGGGDKGGCSCSFAGSDATTSAALPLLVLAFLGLAFRRRRAN